MPKQAPKYAHVCVILTGADGECSKCHSLIRRATACHLPGNHHAYCGRHCPLCAPKRAAKAIRPPRRREAV